MLNGYAMCGVKQNRNLPPSITCCAHALICQGNMTCKRCTRGIAAFAHHVAIVRERHGLKLMYVAARWHRGCSSSGNTDMVLSLRDSCSAATIKKMSPEKAIKKWEIRKSGEREASVPGLMEAGYMSQFKNNGWKRS